MTYVDARLRGVRKFRLTSAGSHAARTAAAGALGGLVLASVVVASVTLPAGRAHLGWLLFLGVTLLGGLASAGLTGRLFPSFAVVGVDGVLVRGRVVHYADILRVQHVCTHDKGGESTFNQDNPWEVTDPADTWRASLRLVSGKVIALRYVRGAVGAKDPEGEALVSAIEAGCGAWLDRRGPDHEVHAQALSRGDRTGAQWLVALRRLGAETTAGYRTVTVDVEDLGRLLDDNRAKLSTRAAAAVALVASGDTTALEELRIAACAMADPRLRIALEHVSNEMPSKKPTPGRGPEWASDA